MYIVELCFECYRDTSLGEAERAIVNYLDMLRYQGQILGREFPTSMHDGYFRTCDSKQVRPRACSVDRTLLRMMSSSVLKSSNIFHTAGKKGLSQNWACF